MKALYNLINWYIRYFNFPYKGWKYFYQVLCFLKLEKRIYQKKLSKNLYINLTPSEHIQKQIFWYGYYEKDAIQLWTKLIKTNSIVIDVGANIGYYSLLAASKATEGCVHAFEPIPRLQEAIKKNILLNRLSNIKLHPFAVSDRKKIATFYFSSDDNLGMSGLCPPENFSGETRKIATICLDEWKEQNHISKIDLVKIDVEGSEMDVLLGMQSILMKDRPIIFIEIIKENLLQFDRTIDEIYSLIHSFNYKTHLIASNGITEFVTRDVESYSVLLTPK